MTKLNKLIAAYTAAHARWSDSGEELMNAVHAATDEVGDGGRFCIQHGVGVLWEAAEKRRPCGCDYDLALTHPRLPKNVKDAAARHRLAELFDRDEDFRYACLDTDLALAAAPCASKADQLAKFLALYEAESVIGNDVHVAWNAIENVLDRAEARAKSEARRGQEMHREADAEAIDDALGIIALN